MPSGNGSTDYTFGMFNVLKQEVDRLEKLIPVLERAQYSHCYGAGPGKKHGCLIAYKQTLFTKVSDHFVRYDQEEVRDAEGERARTGRSFQTRNIGIIVALKSVGDDSQGVIIATTHLFWHPKYVAALCLIGYADESQIRL